MNAGLGYMAAGVTLLSWTVGTFAFTRASHKANPAAVNRVRLIYAFLILSLLVMIFLGKNPITLFSSITPLQYLWFGLSGLVGLTLGDHFAFKAYRILGSRRTSLFTCIAPVAALGGGIVLLGEYMSVSGLLGMLFSIAGILMLILSRKEKQQVIQEGEGSFSAGVLYAILGAVGQGLGLVLAGKGFQVSPDEAFNPMYATWIRMFTASVLGVVLSITQTNIIEEIKSISLVPERLKPVLLGTFFGPVIGVSFSLLAAKNLNASVAQTLFSLVPASVHLTSVLLFKEKVPLISYFALLISIIGVFLLVWRDELNLILQTL